jgi:hypothetical protein
MAQGGGIRRGFGGLGAALLFDAFSSREPVSTSLENATGYFDAFCLREPASTPDQVRGRLRSKTLWAHCRIAAMPVNDAGTVAGRLARPLAAGPVAQWLEPAAHNGLVAGSSPAGPTIIVHSLLKRLPKEFSVGSACARNVLPPRRCPCIFLGRPGLELLQQVFNRLLTNFDLTLIGSFRRGSRLVAVGYSR